MDKRDEEGRTSKANMSKDSKELEGRSNVVRERRRSRSNRKREILEEKSGGDCKIPKEVKKFQIIISKSIPTRRGGQSW